MRNKSPNKQPRKSKNHHSANRKRSSSSNEPRIAENGNRFKEFRNNRKFSRPEYSEVNVPIKNEAAFIKEAVSNTAKALKRWHQDAAELNEQRAVQSQVLESVSPHLDPWQQDVYDSLESGMNIVVDAPTTAGKTRAVESYFHAHINDPNFRAAYTTPVKSLSNDKVREFREIFGRDRVGIATGDIKENLQAPIIVTTLETYRNSLLGVEPDLDRSLVVFDEYHFMQDESRGSAWEEAIILTPPSCQLLLLSASVDNAEDFVAWLDKIHQRRCKLIRTTLRPVPLTSLVHFRDHWLLASELPEKALNVKRQGDGLPIPHKVLAPRLVQLIDLGLTPCIIYAGRRKSVESLIFELAKVVPPLPEKDRMRIGEVLQQVHSETKALSFIDHKTRNLIQTYGIACHHSGMAPTARVAIESLLKEGLLRFCAATMGLSIGINFSVKSTLISDYQRPGERGLSKYGPSEILQMLGRAGRRGRDVVGFSLWPNTESFSRLSSARRDRCESRLKNDPTTFLGLVAQGLDAKDIENFYAKSFRRFGDTGIDLGLIRRNRIESKLGTKKLPCRAPAHEFAMFHRKDGSPTLCPTCPYRSDCHRYIETKGRNDLAALHLHLQKIGALDREDKLSPYGDLAKYFPQTGGLVLARYICDGKINSSRMGACAELMAAVSLARFKQPSVSGRYRFPFDADKLEKELEEYYPIELFPELYDEPFGKREYPVLREFNPEAAAVIRQWAEGCSWKELVSSATNQKFAQGDLISLIYRVASYLQSMAQSRHPELAKMAAMLRDELLREPLTISL